LLGRFFDRYAETVGENVRWIPFRLTGAELVRLADAYPVIERAEADLNRLYGEVLGYEPCEWQPGSYYAAIDAEVNGCSRSRTAQSCSAWPRAWWSKKTCCDWLRFAERMAGSLQLCASDTDSRASVAGVSLPSDVVRLLQHQNQAEHSRNPNNVQGLSKRDLVPHPMAR